MSKKSSIPTTFDNVNTTLGDIQVKFLYKLLFYLADIERNKNVGGFYVKDKDLVKFLAEKQIVLDYKNVPKEHNEKNTIVFTQRGSTCYSLLRHIRNAFAHGRLTKVDNHFEVKDTYKGKMTAYGNFTPSTLFSLIDKIIELKKH